ncbi:MAG: hypothetical protein HXY25_06935 [Alphaproteobacteria bacterium]|nr:hypothetical protein [Alphaproteobacteria bacterium]
MRTQQTPAANLDTGSAGAWEALADAAGAVRKRLQPALNARAEAAGGKAVSEDEQGNLTVNLRTELTEQDAAFNVAARAAYLARASTQWETAVGNLEQGVIAKVRSGEIQGGEAPEAFEAQIDAWRSGIMDTLPGEFAAAAEARIATIAARSQRSVVDTAASLALERARQDVTARADHIEGKLYALFASGQGQGQEAAEYLAEWRANQEIRVATLGITEEAAQLQTRNLEARLAGAALVPAAEDTYRARGLEAARAQVRDFAADPALDLTERDRITIENRALRRLDELERERAEARAEFVTTVGKQVREAETGARLGLDPRDIVDYDAVLAAYPEDGPRMIASLDAQYSAYEAIGAAATADANTRGAIVADAQARADAARADGDVARLARETERVATISEGVGRAQTAFARDPAAYVRAAFPDVKAAWAAVDAIDPSSDLEGYQAAVDAAIAVSLSAQARFDPTRKPSVLSADQEATILSRLDPDPQDPNSRVAMMTEIGRLSVLYGRHWPRVREQLGKAASPALGGAIDYVAESPVIAGVFVDAHTMGKKDLDAALKGIDDEMVLADTQDMRLTLPTGSDGAEFAARYRAYVGALMARGTSASQARTRAQRDLMTNEWVFVGTYRVPRGYDVAAVRETAGRVRMGLTAEDIRVPGSAVPGLTPEARAATYLDGIATLGMWSNYVDDDGREVGLVLRDPLGYVVQRKDGTPVIFRFDEARRTELRPYPYVPVPAL